MKTKNLKMNQIFPSDKCKLNGHKKSDIVPSKYKLSTYSDGFKRQYVKTVLEEFSMISVDETNTKTIVTQQKVTYKDDTSRQFDIKITQERNHNDEVLCEEKKIKVLKPETIDLPIVE